jgi:hypothetical protein
MVWHKHASGCSLVSPAPGSRLLAPTKLVLALLLAGGFLASSGRASAELVVPPGSPVAGLLVALAAPQIGYQQTPFPPSATAARIAPAAEPPPASDPSDAGDPARDFWELAIGSCAGGAFAGALTAASATAPIAVTGVAVPAVASVVLLAAGSGCVMGIASASVSFGSVLGWQRLGRIGTATSY